MSKKQKPDDLIDFLLGLVAVCTVVFAVTCIVLLAVTSDG